MAQLKDLIVNGVGRFIGKVYASEFIGKLTGNADTATTATDADKLDGHHGSVAQSASTYVLRDSNGYINTSYINSNTPLNENPSISQVIVTNGNDHYYRKASLAHLKSSLGSMPANGGNSATVNGHTVNSDVPANAKFTDINTWRPLGTTADTACAGNDARLSNARPASDVYAWAKASSKPSYSWSEITSKPSTFTPSSHTHNYAGSNSAGGNALTLQLDRVGNNANWLPSSPSTTQMRELSNSSYNIPYSQWWQILANRSSDMNYGSQLAMGMTTNDLYFRNYSSGSWGSWRKVIFSDDTISKANYATSAGDADTLDGNHASAFATASHTHSYLPLSGGTMTGVITAKRDLSEDSYSGALNMNNSNIYRLNAIYTADVSEGASEGIHFYRDSTHVDTLWMANGNMYFVPNRALGTNTTASNSNIVLHTGNYKSYCTPANIGAADIECNTIGEYHSVTSNIQVTSTSTTYEVARLNIPNVFSDSAKTGTYLINLEMYLNANGNVQFSYDIDGKYSNFLCTISDIGAGTSSSHRRVTFILKSARQDVRCEIIVKGKFTATKGVTMYATINAIRIGNY